MNSRLHPPVEELVAWLDGQHAVDRSRGIGNQGYCMGGSYTVYTAAAAPARVKGAASFHGGGLVTDKPNSPHRMLQKGTSYLFAIGQNDDAKQPEAKDELRKAADAVSDVPGEVALFVVGDAVGARHLEAERLACVEVQPRVGVVEGRHDGRLARLIVGQVGDDVGRQQRAALQQLKPGGGVGAEKLGDARPVRRAALGERTLKRAQEQLFPAHGTIKPEQVR